MARAAEAASLEVIAGARRTSVSVTWRCFCAAALFAHSTRSVGASGTVMPTCCRFRDGVDEAHAAVLHQRKTDRCRAPQPKQW